MPAPLVILVRRQFLIGGGKDDGLGVFATCKVGGSVADDDALDKAMGDHGTDVPMQFAWLGLNADVVHAYNRLDEQRQLADGVKVVINRNQRMQDVSIPL